MSIMIVNPHLRYVIVMFTLICGACESPEQGQKAGGRPAMAPLSSVQALNMAFIQQGPGWRHDAEFCAQVCIGRSE